MVFNLNFNSNTKMPILPRPRQRTNHLVVGGAFFAMVSLGALGLGALMQAQNDSHAAKVAKVSQTDIGKSN
jgi:hypothetical protein